MFKNKLLILGAVILAFFAIFGVGFSNWYFSNQCRADVVSNVVVTHANTFGEFPDVRSTTKNRCNYYKPQY